MRLVVPIVAIVLAGTAPSPASAHGDVKPELVARVKSVLEAAGTKRVAKALALVDKNLKDLPFRELSHTVSHVPDLPDGYARWLGRALGLARALPDVVGRHELAARFFGSTDGVQSVLQELVSLDRPDVTKRVVSFLIRGDRPAFRWAGYALALQGYLLYPKSEEYMRSVLVLALRDASPALRCHMASTLAPLKDASVLAPIVSGVNDMAKVERHQAGVLSEYAGTVSATCEISLKAHARYFGIDLGSLLDAPDPEVLGRLTNQQFSKLKLVHASSRIVKLDDPTNISVNGPALSVVVHSVEATLKDGIVRREVHVKFSGAALTGGSLEHQSAPTTRYFRMAQVGINEHRIRYWIAPSTNQQARIYVELWSPK